MFSLSLPIDKETVKDNFRKIFEPVTIKDYKCLRCAIKATLLETKHSLNVLNTSRGPNENKVRIQKEQMKILSGFLKSQHIDEDEFDAVYRAFLTQGDNIKYCAKNVRPNREVEKAFCIVT